jgi:hypothetical protein
MKTPRSFKFLIGLSGLVLVVTGLVELRRWASPFSGELCVALGRSERIVVRRTPARRSPLEFDTGLIQRAVPADAIPFDDRETAAGLLNTSETYDYGQLLFSIRLEQVFVLSESEPWNLVKVTTPDAERSMDLVVNGQVNIDGQTHQVVAVRKWSGLLPLESGRPMAAISLREGNGAWTENLFLESGKWRRIEPHIGIRFSWFSSEAAAQEALRQGLPGIESARWGVVDGRAVNWFESFLPGAGAQLANGTAVALLRLDESDGEPAIEIQFVEGGQVRTERVKANERDSHVPIRFEYYSKLETAILLNGFADGEAAAAAYHKQQSCGTKRVEAGQPWRPSGSPYELRLDQAMEHAVSVSLKDSTLYEALLRGPSRELRLRQGEAVRCGDVLLQFIRKAEAPRVRYDLAAVETASNKEHALSLGPDASVRFGDWRFSQASPTADPYRTAVIRAEYSPTRPWVRILMATALACLALVTVFSQAGKEDAPSR